MIFYFLFVDIHRTPGIYNIAELLFDIVDITKQIMSILKPHRVEDLILGQDKYNLECVIWLRICYFYQHQ